MIFKKENIITIRFKDRRASRMDGILIKTIENSKLVNILRKATSCADAPAAINDGA